MTYLNKERIEAALQDFKYNTQVSAINPDASHSKGISNDTVATILAALKLAEKFIGEPSQGFPSMALAGAVKMWDECKDGLIGHDQASAVYKAMRDQMLREIESGE